MAAEDRLAGVRAKLDGAREQVERLRVEWHRFLTEEQPYRMGFEHNPKTGEYLARFQVFKEIPLPLSVIAGEIVHDIRSALDHLACRLVEAHGPESSRCTFPISRSERDFISRVEFPRDRYGKKVRGPLEGIDRRSDAWAYIKRAQPYQGRDIGVALADLADLSNRDKHRVLNASYVFPGVADATEMFVWNYAARFIGAQIFFDPSEPLKHDTKIMLFAFDPNGPDPNVRMKPQIVMEIAFGESRGEARKKCSFLDLIAYAERLAADCAIWLR